MRSGHDQDVHEAVKLLFDRKVVLDPALPGAHKCSVEPLGVFEPEEKGWFSCWGKVEEKLLEDNVRPFRRPPGEMTGYGRVRWVCLK